MDPRIKTALKELKDAHAATERFVAKELVKGEKLEFHDFFEMAEAYDKEKLAWTRYELVRAEVYPGMVTEDRKRELQIEIEELLKDISGWEQRVFPERTSSGK